MKTAIPTSIQQLTKSQAKKQRRDSIYRLYNDLTKEVKDGLKDTTDEELEKLIGGAMHLMKPPEDVEEITLPVASLQQFAVFAAQCVSRQLLERQKK